MSKKRIPPRPPVKPQGSAMPWVVAVLAMALLLLVLFVSTDRSRDTPRTLLPLPVLVLPISSGLGPVLH